MLSLPIASPTDVIRADVEPAVRRLIELTKERRSARADVLDWLRVEFGVETPGQQLEAFAELNLDAFLDEVRRRRPRTATRLTPAALRDLRTVYEQQVPAVRALLDEARTLERRLAHLINAAYGLTAAEEALLWRTAPPRMPIDPPADFEC